MGTRHLILVQSDNDLKLCQYGQWDGYPTGQGEKIRQFIADALHDQFYSDRFKAKLNKLEVVDNDQVNKFYADLGIHGEFITMPDADKFKAKYPMLSRDTSSDIFMLIDKGYSNIVKLDLDCLDNDLFWCEYCYLIDLDNQTFTVYEGHVNHNNVMLEVPFSELSDVNLMNDLEAFNNGVNNE